jgi:hypothetical protein
VAEGAGEEVEALADCSASPWLVDAPGTWDAAGSGSRWAGVVVTALDEAVGGASSTRGAA